MLPRDAIFSVSEYLTSLTTLKADNEQMREKQVLNAQQLQQSQELLAENAHLRKLLAASERLTLKSVMSEILYDARDPFSRKVIIDRGSSHQIQPG
jgi:rod shape-determining protein MreC